MSCLVSKGVGHSLVRHAHPDVKGGLCVKDDCPQHVLCLEEVSEEGSTPGDGPLCGQAWVRVDRPNRGISYIPDNAEYPRPGPYRWLVCAAGHRKPITMEEYMTTATLSPRENAELALGKAIRPQALDDLFAKLSDITEVRVRHGEIGVMTWRSDAEGKRLKRPCTYVSVFTDGKVAVPFVEGTAICHTNDTYDRRLGILIAFNRAVKKLG